MDRNNEHDREILSRYHDMMLAYLKNVENMVDKEIKRLEHLQDKTEVRITREVENIWTVINGLRKHLDNLQKEMGENAIQDLREQMAKLEKNDHKKDQQHKEMMEKNSSSAERTAKIELTTSALEKAAWLVAGGIIVWIVKMIFES